MFRRLVRSTLTRSITSSCHDELQYLNATRDIIDRGTYRQNRTGIATYSLFGLQLRFNLEESKFPLLTTKKIKFKSIVEELLWFIRGGTNSNELAQRGVNIWRANGSRSFLDGMGFVDREEGDLGPIYGFQWRHYGAKYSNFNTNYSRQGIDQLQNVIDLIKNDPTSRRIIMTAWNPVDIPAMVLPPCHVLVQFYVAGNKLSSQLYQRSADMGLGVPFNIASYALLTRMIAHVTGLEVGDFVHSIGDAHVYENHVEALMEQVERVPREFPRLVVRGDGGIDDFDGGSFELVGYKPHPVVRMDMAV